MLKTLRFLGAVKWQKLKSEMKTTELVHNYLVKPYDFWGAGDRRALKVEKRLRAVMTSLKLPRPAALEYLQELAVRRVSEAQPTLYLCNAGSSGSHWVQGLLSAITPILPCGEVYLPKQVLAQLKADKSEDKKAALQLIYLLHSFLEPTDGVDVGRLVHALACNTAHAPGNLHVYRASDISNYAVLLLRDPADIAVSRTFRKEQHRAYLGKADDSDLEFLKFNCNFVTNFYNGVSESDFDITVRYEDLLKTPGLAMRKVCDAIKINASNAELERAAELFNKDQLKTNSQEAKASNIYAGERKKVDKKYVNYAREATASLRQRLGY